MRVRDTTHQYSPDTSSKDTGDKTGILAVGATATTQGEYRSHHTAQEGMVTTVV